MRETWHKYRNREKGTNGKSESDNKTETHDAYYCGKELITNLIGQIVQIRTETWKVGLLQM